MTKPTGKLKYLTPEMHNVLTALRDYPGGRAYVTGLARATGYFPDTHEVQRWVTSLVGKGFATKTKTPGVRSPTYEITDSGREHLEKLTHAEA